MAFFQDRRILGTLPRIKTDALKKFSAIRLIRFAIILR